MEEELNDVIGEFDAGIFTQKFLAALKVVALGVIDSGKKGKVTIDLELSQIGVSSSVQVKHTLKFSKPTQNGKTNEENSTSTPMYVGRDGGLSISPQLQEDIFNSDKSNNVTKLKGMN